MKRFIKVSAKLILLFFSISIILFYSIYQFTPIVNDSVEELINYFIKNETQVSFKNLSGILINQADFEDVHVVLKNGQVIRAKKLHARFSLLSIIRGSYFIEECKISGFELNYENAKPGEDDGNQWSIYEEIGDVDLQINNLTIVDGILVFDSLNLDIIDNVKLEADFTYLPGNLKLDLRRFSGTWKKHDINLKSISTLLEGDEDGVIFNQSKILFNDTYIVGKGQFKFDIANHFSVFLDEAEFYPRNLKFISPVFEYESKLNFVAELFGDRYGFDAKLNIDSARISKLDIGKSFINASYKYQLKELNVIDSKIIVNDAELSVQGEILNKNNYTAQFKHVDLQKFFISKFPTDLNGEGKVFQDKIDFKNFSTDTNEIHFTQSKIDRFEFSSADIHYTNDKSDFFILANSYIRSKKNDDFYISGDILGINRLLFLNLYSTAVSYEDYLEDYGLPAVSGKFTGVHEVSGTFDQINVSSSLLADSVSYKTTKAKQIRLESNLVDIFSNIKGSVNIDANNLALGGLSFDKLNLTAEVDSSSIRFDSLNVFTDENGIFSSGIYTISDSMNRIDLNHLRFTYKDYKIENNKPIRFEFTDSTLMVERFVLNDTEVGQIIGYGNADSITFSFRDFEIGTMNSLIAYRHALQGNSNGDLVVYDFNNLNFSLDVFVNALSIFSKDDPVIFNRIGEDTVHFGEVSTRLKFENNTVVFKEISVNERESFLRINGNARFFENDTLDLNPNILAQTKLNIDAVFSNIDIKKYNIFIDYYKELDGRLDGKISVGGTLGKPKGSVSISTNLLKVNELRYIGGFESHFDYKEWLFDSIAVRVNESQLFATGAKQLNFELNNFWELFNNEPFEFKVNSAGDTLTALNAVVNDLSAIFGDYELEFILKGTFDHPYIESGYINLNNSTIVLDRLANPLTGVTYRGKIKDNFLLINNLTANSYFNSNSFFGIFDNSKRGKIIVNGSLDFSHLLHPVTDIKIKLQDFYANYYKQSIEVILNSENIHVTGRDTLLMVGDIRVDQGDWNFDYEDNLKTSYLNEQNLSTSRVIMDFRVQLVDNFRVHYTDANGIGSFDMFMQTPIGEYFYWKTDADGNPQTRGIIEIDNGSFTNYKTFDIEQGIINFNKKDNNQNWFNPWVDFKATREEDEYTFKVLFNDFLTRLSEFKLQVFDENLEQLTLSDQQRFNLLIFGQKDLNNFNLRSVVTNVTFLLANSRFFNALGIENLEINDAEQNNNQDNTSNSSPSVKVKSKVLPLIGNLRTRFELNSAYRGLGFEYIGLIYKLSDHFRIDLSRDQQELFNQQTTDLQENYNLRLKWYYEF